MLFPQQSPPSKWQPALFVSSSQKPSPIQLGLLLKQPIWFEKKILDNFGYLLVSYFGKKCKV